MKDLRQEVVEVSGASDFRHNNAIREHRATQCCLEVRLCVT